MSNPKDRRTSDDFDDLPDENRHRWDREDRYSAVRNSARDAVRRANSNNLPVLCSRPRWGHC